MAVLGAVVEDSVQVNKVESTGPQHVRVSCVADNEVDTGLVGKALAGCANRFIVDVNADYVPVAQLRISFEQSCDRPAAAAADHHHLRALIIYRW